MALDALRCNHLAPLGFKGLTNADKLHATSRRKTADYAKIID